MKSYFLFIVVQSRKQSDASRTFTECRVLWRLSWAFSRSAHLQGGSTLAVFMDFRHRAVTQNLTFGRTLCLIDTLAPLLEILGTGAPRFPFALGPASCVTGPGNQGAFLYSMCIGSVIFSLSNDPGPLMT